ncbi:hypothetical protein OUZ56_019426 [Daphnia magna]|uniref:Uncharacterized protein n=1 Tax=Daphnia magna TaxID=35525 RepID=A0ABQ9ZBJ7_9CRUS|nr:hypothetical protein OUZ56_019426 [Daphnia magna]
MKRNTDHSGIEVLHNPPSGDEVSYKSLAVELEFFSVREDVQVLLDCYPVTLHLLIFQGGVCSWRLSEAGKSVEQTTALAELNSGSSFKIIIQGWGVDPLAFAVPVALAFCGFTRLVFSVTDGTLVNNRGWTFHEDFHCSTFLTVRQLRNEVCVLSHVNSPMLTTTIILKKELA